MPWTLHSGPAEPDADAVRGGAEPSGDEETLDPADWQNLRKQGHQMLDDMFDHLETLRDRPVWQPIPQPVRDAFHSPLPLEPTPLREVYESFLRNILPYSVGNTHPGFMGWVHGGGTVVGMLAEMLAAGLNTNLGGRTQALFEVERQILQWVREVFEFPPEATGLFVTGSSMANLIGVLVAHTGALGTEVRQLGLGHNGRRLVAYTSAGAHGCITQAMELSGLGSAALRRIPLNADFQLDVAVLRQTIAADRRNGLAPFLIVGTAGSVDVGGIDDLEQLADVARQEDLWLHVDGAFAALGKMSPEVAPLLAGIERADSLAFDFHKWGQVPYDAGFILVRDGTLHLETFASSAAYLNRDDRAMSANSPWPCDFGPDLSRGFRALKTWFTLKVYGARKLGRIMHRSCQVAKHLQVRIQSSPELELLAPVTLNVVCFRFRSRDNADELNAAILARLQRSGIAAPSSTIIHGQFAIRAAIVNHRTQLCDVDALIRAVIHIGRSLQGHERHAA